VLVHGFTQTRRSWDRLADALADRFEVLAVDAPGHGDSGHLQLGLPAAADALAALAGPATYVGYSMGGRLALHLAVRAPQLVRRLVLVSASPGIADAADRAERRAADERLAAEIERDGVDAFLERWLARPMFAGLPAGAAGLESRRANTAAGLASSLRLAGTGAQASLWGALEELPMPVLVVAGAGDAKFAAIAEQMARLIPRATLAVVPGAGHVVHLEQHDEFAALLLTWIAATFE
jgi:2-succinyl-6-hydroxy-2,4-cyclohexadiene-1-carboxylate synthase